MRNLAAKDNNYQKLVKALKDGKTPKECDKSHPIREMAGIWSKVSVLDDRDDTLLLVDNQKLVVLTKLQQQIVDDFH